jgi:hypothetical protein
MKDAAGRQLLTGAIKILGCDVADSAKKNEKLASSSILPE